MSEIEIVKKCEGCKKRNVKYEMVNDDGDHHWECMNCGYRVASLLEVKLKGER